MVKVAHLTSVHDPFDTRVFHKECQTLREAGYDVVLVAAHGADENVDGIRIRAVPPPSSRLSRFFRTAIRVTRIAWSEQPAVIHIHDPELLPFAQLLRLLGRRVIYDMHENVPKALLTKQWIPAPLRRMCAISYGVTERLLLAGIPVILAETSYEKDYRWLRRRVTVLNLPLANRLFGISEEKFARPTVGYIGVVSPHRGSRITIQALERLHSEGLDVDWECVGRISNDCKVAAETRLGERARVRGPLSAAEGLPLMARCHVGLAVLSPIPNYIGSYPTKLFEYMALGLPVVASDFPLYRDIVETSGCGICVNPADPAAVASAIRWLIDHPADAHAMGERGRAAVRTRYNWQAEGDKLTAFYADLLREA